jgi:hypothetical protein
MSVTACRHAHQETRVHGRPSPGLRELTFAYEFFCLYASASWVESRTNVLGRKSGEHFVEGERSRAAAFLAKLTEKPEQSRRQRSIPMVSRASGRCRSQIPGRN